MPDTVTPEESRQPQPPRDGTRRGSRLVWGASAVMLVCCAGQGLLLAAGLGGLGAVTGNARLLVAAAVALAGSAALMAVRRRRRRARACDPRPNIRPRHTSNHTG